jgi:hypothetical protein
MLAESDPENKKVHLTSAASDFQKALSVAKPEWIEVKYAKELLNQTQRRLQDPP